MTSDDNGIFPIFDVSGSAAARGKQYGRQAGDLIRVSANIYKNVFEQKGISWEKACDLARYFMPQIEQYNPDLLTEIKAVAEGAELPAEEIVAINARTEIMYGTRRQAKKEAETDIDGCTGAIAKADITANGHTIHGQNWDWRDECADAAMVLRIRPDIGPDIMTFVEAGILARCGMNSDGIAITGNHLQSDDDFD
ncbi:MAG: hypothetical protein JKY57_02165, partial [Kordiimonadaceae bacterium]|nr:hypothetical protein [Kordiimonadaceae bacterium]